MIQGLYKCFDHWHQNGTLFIYSDPHFGDKELAAAHPQRPSDEEHIKLINSKVGRKDTLILLGDVGDLECAKKLRGYKVLVCGNHDAGRTHYESVFDEVYTGPVMIGERLILSHEPIPGLSWAMNIHGHVHDPKAKSDKYHWCVCSDATGYKLLHFNSWMKEGHLAHVQSLHRDTIDTATRRKRKRERRK